MLEFVLTLMKTRLLQFAPLTRGFVPGPHFNVVFDEFTVNVLTDVEVKFDNSVGPVHRGGLEQELVLVAVRQRQ